MINDATAGLSALVVSLLGPDLIGIIGIIGVVFYIGAYLALQLGLIRGDTYLFPSLNLVASGSILISLSINFNPFAAFIETSWVTISCIGIARVWFVKHFVNLSAEEQQVAAILVPRAKKDRAKRLLRIGRFIDANEGLRIAEEGLPLEDLSLLVRGHCRIEHGGRTVAISRDGALVGELTYATGAPATASVIVGERSRLFLINCKVLRGFLSKNPDLALELESAITGDLRAKLTDTTRRLHGQNPIDIK